MAEFELRAIQGQDVTYTVTLSASGFAGTEALAADVNRGDTQAALLTVTPTWNTGDAQTSPPTLIDLPFAGTDLASLAPGSYAILVRLVSGDAALAAGLLTIYPAAGGTAAPYYRALTTPAVTQSLLPDLSQDQIDTLLPMALPAATRAIETFCGMPLVLDSYDHIIRGFSGKNRIRLRTQPVWEVSRISANVASGATVTNGGGVSMTGATITEVMTGPGSLQIASLVFTTVLSGVATTQTLTMVDHPTWDDLCTAINALGNGWGATTQMGSAPTSDGFGSPGVRNCLNRSLWIHTHCVPLADWWLRPGSAGQRASIEINEGVPGGMLIPNPRIERSDSRYWGVRCTYRGGYATQQADIDLGYYPVPEDLQIACAMTAYAMIENVATVGPVKSQTVKDRSYALKDDISVIPQAALAILSRYVDVVF